MKKTTKMFWVGFIAGVTVECINVLANPNLWKKRKYKILYVDDECSMRRLEIEERGLDMISGQEPNRHFMAKRLD